VFEVAAAGRRSMSRSASPRPVRARLAECARPLWLILGGLVSLANLSSGIVTGQPPSPDNLLKDLIQVYASREKSRNPSWMTATLKWDETAEWRSGLANKPAPAHQWQTQIEIARYGHKYRSCMNLLGTTPPGTAAEGFTL
jgi:hypothetical protein